MWVCGVVFVPYILLFHNPHYMAGEKEILIFGAMGGGPQRLQFSFDVAAERICKVPVMAKCKI